MILDAYRTVYPSRLCYLGSACLRDTPPEWDGISGLGGFSLFGYHWTTYLDLSFKFGVIRERDNFQAVTMPNMISDRRVLLLARVTIAVTKTLQIFRTPSSHRRLLGIEDVKYQSLLKPK